MSDPVSVAGTAVGIVSLGITVAQGLVKYYSSWKDCPTDVSNTLHSLKGLLEILILVKQSVEAGQLEKKLQDQINNAVSPCEATVRKLQAKLEKIPCESIKPSFRDQWKSKAQRAQYPFRESTLAKFRELASDLKENLGLALHIANLYVRRLSPLVECGQMSFAD